MVIKTIYIFLKLIFCFYFKFPLSLVNFYIYSLLLWNYLPYDVYTYCITFILLKRTLNSASTLLLGFCLWHSISHWDNGWNAGYIWLAGLAGLFLPG
jgi:hypothetical protein